MKTLNQNPISIQLGLLVRISMETMFNVLNFGKTNILQFILLPTLFTHFGKIKLIEFNLMYLDYNKEQRLFVMLLLNHQTKIIRVVERSNI